ncbi:MAG: hypothetical protein AAGE84_15365 [Cyanobacteria bacterium P01_G01_bin.39]
MWLRDIGVIPFGKKFWFKVTACLLALILSACGNRPPTTINLYPDGLVDVAAITQNFDSYLNRTVLVRNDVVKKIGERGLVLDHDRVFSGDDILVVSTVAIPPLFSRDQTPEVVVSGTIERFVLPDLSAKYSLDLDFDLYAKYEGKPVIIAKSLIFSPDPEDLTHSPEMYYGQPLAIKGEIEDIRSYGVFELDEEQVFGGEDLLVLQLPPVIELKEEQMAIVYGKLRPFVVVELTQDYNLNWDLSIQKQIAAEYEQKPVLVTDNIKLLN